MLILLNKANLLELSLTVNGLYIKFVSDHMTWKILVAIMHLI